MRSRHDTPYTSRYSAIAHLRINYRCENCNQRNTDDSHTIKLEAEYEPGCHDLRGVESSAEARQKLQKKAKNVCGNIKYKRYDKLRLRCRCKSCGKVPLWATYSKLGLLSDITLTFGCMIFLLAFLGIITSIISDLRTPGHNNQSIFDKWLNDPPDEIGAIGLSLVLMIPKAIDLIINAFIDRRVRQMDERYLPEILLLTEGDRPVSTSDPFFELNHTSRDVAANEWKCPKCGVINQNYVGTCGCGAQKPDR